MSIMAEIRNKQHIAVQKILYSQKLKRYKGHILQTVFYVLGLLSTSAWTKKIY